MRWGRRGLLVYAAVREGERGGLHGWDGAWEVEGRRGGNGGERWQVRVPRSCQGSGTRAWGPDSAFRRLHLPDAYSCPLGRFLPLSPRRSEPWRCGCFPSFPSSQSRPLCGSRISPRFAVLFLLSSSDEAEAIIARSGGRRSPSPSWKMQECKRIVVFRVGFVDL